MNSNLFSQKLKPITVKEPKAIVKEICKELIGETEGNVIAKVSTYTRVEISTPSFWSALLSSYAETTRKSAQRQMSNSNNIAEEGLSWTDIQNDLGDIGERLFTYEVYITSIARPRYKYRVMFLQYGIPYFPTLLVLDEAIASELKTEQKLVCNSQEEFEKALEQIFCSDKVLTVINSLFSISQSENSLQTV